MVTCIPRRWWLEKPALHCFGGSVCLALCFGRAASMGQERDSCYSWGHSQVGAQVLDVKGRKRSCACFVKGAEAK